MTHHMHTEQPSFGLYVHIPYCAGRCLYCSFYTAGSRQADWTAYSGAVLREFEAQSSELAGAPYTLYIGGGTPSLMPHGVLTDLVRGLVRRIGAEPVELTVEANPEDVTPGLAEAWAEAGATRVSLGVQTLDDELLCAMGRRHYAATALRAIETLGERFGNISADLIFGLPGQTVAGFADDVRRLLDTGVRHLSAYSLMYEERAALTVLRDTGRVREVADVDSEGMFRILNRLAREAGLRRYELSNYAAPGFESRHNSLYWDGRPYLGLGPSAHSYDGLRRRRANRADIRAYMQRWGTQGGAEDKGAFFDEEALSDEELREEYLLTRLRLAEGLELGDYTRRWGDAAARRLLRQARPHAEAGRLAVADGRVALTDDGVMTSDDIIVDLSL